MKRSTRNARWIEKYLRVPEGRYVGRPIKLEPWQKAELRRIYDNPAGTRLAIISFGRKNGKTALAAMLLLLHLVGPESRINSSLVSAAQSRDQAAILFKLASKMVRFSPVLIEVVKIIDSSKQLLCPDRGTEYRALSADASTNMGQSPCFIVHDELGEVRGGFSDLYEALESATGAQDEPLSVVISTQAPSDADFLSTLIDDALRGEDPHTVISLYTADPDDERSDEKPKGCSPFSIAHIKKANPAFGRFQNADEVKRQADNASRMPQREAWFRNRVLNQRVDASAPFVSRSVWKACGGKVDASLFDDGAEVYMGLDLSSVRDLTAEVAIAREGFGEPWHAQCEFWLPRHGLIEKSEADKVPYDVWRQQGLLTATPGRSIDYNFVAARIFTLCERWNVVAIGYDRWGFGHLKPYLKQAGFREDQIEGDDALFVPLGQGFATMSPALRDLEADLLEGRLRHGGHEILTMCAFNAIVTEDPAGNRKFDKKKATGRIDGLQALAMARSVASTSQPHETGPSVYETRGALVL